MQFVCLSPTWIRFLLQDVVFPGLHGSRLLMTPGRVLYILADLVLHVYDLYELPRIRDLFAAHTVQPHEANWLFVMQGLSS